MQELKLTQPKESPEHKMLRESHAKLLTKKISIKVGGIYNAIFVDPGFMDNEVLSNRYVFKILLSTAPDIYSKEPKMYLGIKSNYSHEQVIDGDGYTNWFHEDGSEVEGFFKIYMVSKADPSCGYLYK